MNKLIKLLCYIGIGCIILFEGILGLPTFFRIYFNRFKDFILEMFLTCE